MSLISLINVLKFSLCSLFTKIFMQLWENILDLCSVLQCELVPGVLEKIQYVSPFRFSLAPSLLGRLSSQSQPAFLQALSGGKRESGGNDAFRC